MSSVCRPVQLMSDSIQGRSSTALTHRGAEEAIHQWQVTARSGLGFMAWGLAGISCSGSWAWAGFYPHIVDLLRPRRELLGACACPVLANGKGGLVSLIPEPIPQLLRHSKQDIIVGVS